MQTTCTLNTEQCVINTKYYAVCTLLYTMCSMHIVIHNMQYAHCYMYWTVRCTQFGKILDFAWGLWNRGL